MEKMVLKTQVASLCENNKEEFAIFTSQRKYSIPGYQRPYEWDNEKIDKMMKTLFEFYQEEKEGDPSYENDLLLFGTIQLNINRNNEYEIIDGQQRLVSFYLLIRALKESDASLQCLYLMPVFNVTNHIRDDYNHSFANANVDDEHSPYSRNYSQMKEQWLKNLKNPDDSSDFFSFFNMVVSRVKFVVIITENIPTIDRTLQIFTSLNTTGLPLDLKDVFKVKFCDFLSGDNNNTEDNLSKINEAYALLKELKYINGTDLLDVYRFYLLWKTKQGNSKNIKVSNQKFFSDVFDDSGSYTKIRQEMKVDDIVAVASVIKQTEDILQQKRNCVVSSEHM